MVRSDLSSFPRPSVAVDVAVMTVLPEGELGLLLHRRIGDRAGEWALPGRFLRDRERLSHAVAAALSEKCDLPARSLAGAVPRQLHVFDDPARDNRGWVLSMAHLLGLPYLELAPAVTARPDLRLVVVKDGRLRLPDRQRQLPYGQDEIVLRAVEELRWRYEQGPDPEGLLGTDVFTLSELRDVHAAVLGEAWQIDTFRRRMQPHLVETGEQTSGGPGRPAALFSKATSR